VLIALLAPLLLGLAPRLRVPAVVLEIVAGIVVGPHGLGLVAMDLPLQIVSLLGLKFPLIPGRSGDSCPSAARTGTAPGDARLSGDVGPRRRR
jgi:hypothetical protein